MGGAVSHGQIIRAAQFKINATNPRTAILETPPIGAKSRFRPKMVLRSRSPTGQDRPRAEWQLWSDRTGNLPFVPAKPFGRFRPNSVACPIRATSPKQTRGQGCSTGNNGGVGVQSKHHIFPDLVRWTAGPSGARPGRGPICAYCAVMPPSITSSEPVTQDDSSDARNSTPLAISSAVPSRPIGVRSSSTWRTAGSLKRFSVSGVSA
jgi:hypothetical protein